MVYLTASEYMRISETIEENYFNVKITLKDSNWGQCIKYYPLSTKGFLKKIFAKNRLKKLTYPVLSEAASRGAL